MKNTIAHKLQYLQTENSQLKLQVSKLEETNENNAKVAAMMLDN